MNYLKQLSLAATGFILCAMTSLGIAQDFDSPMGQWKTKIQTQNGAWLSHGVMTFHSSKRADYTLRNGRILFFEVDDTGKWKGHWIEDKQPWVVCAEKRDGSTAWGEAIFQFDAEFKKFRGSWDKCGDGKRNIWQGYRM